MSEKKRRGRPSLEDRFGKDKILKAYEVHETLRKTAAALGISHVALASYFRRNDIKYKNRREALELSKKNIGHSSVIAEFLERNTDQMLPRDFSKLAFLAGCSRNSISCYFYRRRKALKKSLKNLPNLTKLDCSVQDELGAMYNTKSFKSYEYLIDKFTLYVTILAVLKDNSQVLIKIEDTESFIKKINSYRKKSN